MYPNTYFAQATVAVVAGVLVALGSLGSGWSPTEFTFAVALAGYSCDVVVMTDTLCQDGQRHHGTSPNVGRGYRDLNSRPTA